MNFAATKVYPILVSLFFLANLVLSSLGQYLVPPHTHGTGLPTRATSAQEHRAFRAPHQHWAMVDQYGSLAWYSVYTEDFSERPVVARVEQQEFSGKIASLVARGWRVLKCGENTSSSPYCTGQEILLSLQPADTEFKPISYKLLHAGHTPSIDHIPREA